MRSNEMGNQSTSGIKEEEKGADEVPVEPQEAVIEEKVEEENRVIYEGQTKDFHEKEADLSSHYPSAAKDTDAERHDSDEKEQGGKQSESAKLTEASRESIHSVSQDDYVENANSSYETNMEKKILQTDEKLHIHDQYSIETETNEGQTESSGSNSESKYTVQDSKPVDDATSPMKEYQSLALQESEEVKELSESCHMEDQEKKNGDYMDRKHNIDDLEVEGSIFLEDIPSETNIVVEKCGKNEDVEVPLKVNLNDIPSSPTETIPVFSSQNPLAACPQPQEKHIVHAEEMKLLHGKSENWENMADSEQTVNELMVNKATPPAMLQEDFCTGKRDENMVKIDLENALPNEGAKVIPNGSEGISIDKKNFVATVQEQYRDTEEVVVMPEILSTSNESTAIDKHDKETTEQHFVEETEKKRLEPWSTRNGSTHDKGAISQTFESFGGENALVSGYHASQIKSENGPAAAYPSSLFNSHSGNGTAIGCGAAEDENKFTINLKQHISCEVFIKTPNPCNGVQELAQKVQMNSGTVAQNERLISQSNKKIITGETSTLPSSKPQESAARLSLDSNPDDPSTRIKLRKSPSFEFGLQLDARSEESDQTPLLVRDKSLARSFSGSANVRFQNTMIPPDYSRKSLDYEPMEVQEKTIRMERSDSNISRDSFMNFLKKDASVDHTLEKKDVDVVAEKKTLESPSQELALTSVKGNGKRKPRSSLLSACICCSAAIH